MRIPHLHRAPRHRLNFHSLGFQTGLEIAAGGVATAMLLRWFAM